MVQTKSRHHKTENSYRFQTLNERLANISVDVTKKINRFQQKPEETETYFYQCLEKWVDLNYTGVFHEFTNKIKSKCQTLALLIYHKDHLIETLKEFIARANELSLQPILDLTAQLARDLQSDYYFYFPDIFKSIIKLLDTQNTEILEWAFQTLSYLFKFLWRYMLKDLHTVYALYSPLFEESRKFYIRNFAAESFAFLMRKIPDKNELFDFLLTKRLIEHPQEISGIGRLIFEMFKGIKHQFNTCTGPSFQILLTKLNFFDNEQKNELIFRCIGKTVQSMADFTKKEHSSIVWTCFYKGIDDSVENKKKLTFILRLLEIFLESKNCYLVNNLDLLLDNMVKLAQIEIDSTQASTDFTKHFFNLANLVLLSQNIKFPIEKINILPNELYQVKFDCKLVSDLTRALFDYPFFETNIFPNLISYFDNQIKYKCHSKNQIETCFLTLLAEYLLKQKKILEPNYNTESLSEDKIENFIQIKGLTNLNRLFKSDKLFLDSELAKHLDEFLKNEIKNIENVELIIKILISNFIVGNSSNFDNLNQVANKLMETLEQEMNMDNFEDKNLTNFELNCYLLSLTIWSLSICTRVSCQKSIVDLVLKLNEAKNNLKLKQIVSYDVDAIDLSSKHLLQALRYSYDNENEFDSLRPLAGHLRSELSSPFSECRINSLFLLSALLKHSGLAVNDDNENLLDQCLKIELTPASLDEYRQKIYYLQKLDPLVSKKLVDNELTEEVPLRYIFGLLYENFKLFWDPTVQMIVSYANSMKQNDFWNIFYDFLVDLTHKIESKAQACRRSENTEKKADQFDLIKYLDKSRLGNVESIDYMNNRILLCKSMQSFAQICESKTKVLVPLFFRFMNNEYYREENRLLSTSYDDLTKKYIKDKSNEKLSKEKYFNKKLLNKHLCTFLDIFAKFTSPKSWHQEENLRNLYLNLLCHYDSSVQKSALSCLYTYQYEFVKPYRENLEKLLEGKHFRHELVIFNLDEGSGVIHNDHRQKLLPILMRILYGKFNSNETTHTSSRDTKFNKRSTIIQFLSSCAEYELNYFFNLIFDSINVVLLDLNEKNSDRFDFNDNNYDEARRDQFLINVIKRLSELDSSIYDVKKCIPFKKILGILQTMDILFKKLARQMENFSHRVLLMLSFIQKYTLKLHDEIIAINKDKKLVDEYHVNLIRVIKQQVSIRFKQFFDTFDHLNFTQCEYYLIFDSFVWPQSVKLPVESLQSVNNLLKIFHLWSERPKYFPLFVTKKTDFTLLDPSIISQQPLGSSTLLTKIFELIDTEKCSQKVIDYVLELVHNLVSFADFKEEENSDPERTLQLPFNIILDSNEELNFGTSILRPHVNSIVNHIEKLVSANMSKKVLPSRPLKILARISSFASNSQSQCQKIILLLVPYLVKNRIQSEENEVNILNSINYLLKQVQKVSDFVLPLSRLFLVIKNRQSRIELVNIFNTIQQLDSNFAGVSKLISDLNAWDAKKLDEPDYLLRLEAFKQINEMVASWSSFDINLAAILIYNCFFFINEIGDLAIKESSTNSIKILLDKSSSLELNKQEKNLFEANFMSCLKLGLKSSVENCRHEYIIIFVELVDKFTKYLPFLKDFHILFDLEDPEKDFFENIKHIQMHRRARALKRLQIHCQHISNENLLGFMMPLVRSFLDNEMYHKYDYLIEDACHTIGAICCTLDWSKYIKIVEYYLKILPKNKMNPKLVIKILVQVLDAFHYDLSLSTETDYYVDKETEEKTDQMEEGARRKKLVGSAMANKIHSTVTKSIIPVLFKCLTKKLRSEGEHKMNKHEDEDEQILRVPMALAILKLLNNLPRRTLETHLPGLLYKVCDMLKSRAMSVRNTTRDCLIKMVETLPDKKYYLNVFRELGNSLLKGYQVHVLCFTNLVVLKNVQCKLQVGDLDSSLAILLNSVRLELFSDSSEEKEVKQIVSKLMEAKTVSSFQSLQIIAKFLSQSEFLTLLKPFKEQLDLCTTRKMIIKIEEALKYIMNGLLENSSLNTESIMCLVYGLINDTFDAFKDPSAYKKKLRKRLADQNEVKPANFDEEMNERKMPESCLIIPVEPRRGGDKPKTQAKTNQHIIIEFALQLMNSLMRQNRLLDANNQTRNVQLLDPYIPLFVEYLDGKFLKVTIITLRCLSGLLKCPLPSIDQNCKLIAAKLFNLLRTYSSSSSESERGENLELLMICYKVISNLIRDVKQFNLDDEQLQVLLHYAERNLYDNQKQSSAFNLLKAILSRRLACEELTEVLGKVMKLSIQADSPNVRLQSRQTMLQYMLEYSLAEKKLVKLLEFYVMQLNYEYENGRESAIEMLATMFSSFPMAKLDEHAALFYLPLAIQFHNDDSAKCKKLACLAIKSLIEKISEEKKDNLFNMTISLFKNDQKPIHKRIAALLIKIFVESEQEKFEKRVEIVFKVLKIELNSENFSKNVEMNTDATLSEKFYDQYLYNLLSLLIKILTDVKILNDKNYAEIINDLYDQVKCYLSHEHLWIRLASCQLFGILFANNSVENLLSDKASFFNHKIDDKLIGNYLKIRNLIDDFCEQLRAPVLESDLAEQIVKNLAFMSKILIHHELKNDDQNELLKHDIDIEWLIKKIGKEAKYELVNKPKETIKRTFIFKLFAAISIELGKEKLKNYVQFLIPLLQRETEIDQNDENLKHLAKEVLNLIKTTIGIEDFSLIYSKTNKKRVEFKEERKRKLAQLAVVDPQMSAAKKIRKQQRKKDAKKRKITHEKEKIRGVKKQKTNNFKKFN